MKHIGNIKYAEGAKKKRKRIARGPGSGHGGTSTQGHKGQKSRSGAKISSSFEGGQMPMNRRLPKFGFTNRFRTEYQIINVGTIQELINKEMITGTVDFEALMVLGIINEKTKPLKVLGDGELTSAIQVKAHRFTGSAKEKIEAAGGAVEVYE
jgi:large subunit ribosomal protein L15